MKNGRHNSRGKREKKIAVYNSNGAKSSYEVCTGEIHRRVMEILCAGSCRGNVRGMRWEGVGKLVSLSFPFFFLLLAMNRTAPGCRRRRRRRRKPADKGGLWVTGTFNSEYPDCRSSSVVTADYYCQ